MKIGKYLKTIQLSELDNIIETIDSIAYRKRKPHQLELYDLVKIELLRRNNLRGNDLKKNFWNLIVLEALKK